MNYRELFTVEINFTADQLCDLKMLRDKLTKGTETKYRKELDCYPFWKDLPSTFEKDLDNQRQLEVVDMILGACK